MQDTQPIFIRSQLSPLVSRLSTELSRKKQLLRILYVCLAFAWFGSSVFALNPNQPLDQLYHSSWNAMDGLNGNVLALAQTTDGYLWVGTTDGLFRFDGLTFELYRPEVGSFSSNSVSALFAPSNGGLWIGYLRGGASFLKDGKVINYSGYAGREGFPAAKVRAFAQDWDGTIWAAVVGGFTRLEGNHWHTIHMEWNYPDKSASALFVDKQGTLWVAGGDVVMFLPKGEKKFHDSGIRVNSFIPAFAQLPDGTMWFLDGTHDLIQPLPLPQIRGIAPASRAGSVSNVILIDHDGNFWMVGEPQGLFQVPFPKWAANTNVGKVRPGVETFDVKQGLTDIQSNTVLEDREGNIWVGTDGGLDRFRYRNLTWNSLHADSHSFSLVAGDHGDILAGTRYGPILRIPDGTPIKGSPLDTYVAYRAANGTTWFGARDVLARLQGNKFLKVELPDQVTKSESIFKNKDPILINSITVDHSGSMWVSIAGFGEFQLKGDLWKFVPVLKDHPDWTARSAFTDSSNRVWLVFGEIVAVVDHDRVQTFSPKEGLNIALPNIVDGRDDQVWVGGESGIAFFQGNSFHPLIAADGSNFGLITGIVVVPNDGLWLAAGPGIVHIPEREIQNVLQHPNDKVAYELFDLISDLPEPLQRGGTYSTGVIRGEDGMLWFATRGGVARVDPTHIVRNSLPPPVSIRAVVADNKAYSVSTKAFLPPLTRNLQIDYTALSLSIPERERFRYKLEGSDDNWQDVGTRRQAFYRDLHPGTYRFHVIACNNDGVWNETGAALDFSIAPAWYQTLWFRLLCTAFALSLIYSAYLFRLRQHSATMKLRYDERLQERTRIARELHDTLLQTIQGSKLVVDEAMGSTKDINTAKIVLGRLSKWLARASVEGRAVLDSLRHTIADSDDFMTAFRRTFEDYKPDNGIKLKVSTTGESQEMDPIARDEIYRIGDEAIRNACLHSEGKELTIELIYDKNLSLRICDDGSGIDSRIIDAGRAGHYGLLGMKERAERLGADLEITSSPSGTEIILRVPGKAIYSEPKKSLLKRLRSRVSFFEK